jgi:hypothetical protein
MYDSEQFSGVRVILVHKRKQIRSLTSIWANTSYFSYYPLIQTAFQKARHKTYTIYS